MTVTYDEQGQWPSEIIPKSWLWISFSDFFYNCTNSQKKLPQKQYLDQGNIPVIDQGEVVIGGYTDNITLKYDGQLPVIIWGDHTKCIKFIDYEFVQGADGVKVLLPKNGIDTRYAYYALQTIKLPNKGYSRHFKFLNSSKFPLPPLNEQHRIVAKLDTLFSHSRRAREELDRVPKLIKRYKQAVLSAAFRGDLTEDWREENPDIKESWKSFTLGSVINNIRYGTSKKCDYLPELIPVLRIPNIGDGYIVHNDIKYANFDSKEIESLKLQIGDILVIRSNGSIDLVGKAAIISEQEKGFLYAGYLIRLRPNFKIILPKYFYFHLAEPKTRNEIESLAKSTSGVNNINSQELQSLSLCIPGLQEQQEIVRRVEKLFKAIDKMEEQYQKARKLLDRLDQATLSKAFRGELVPQDPNDVPASVLLERIQSEKQTKITRKLPP